MPLLTLGINHKTAPVEIRERVAFTPDQVINALRHLKSSVSVSEAAILSTCNRTELLCCTDSANEDLIIGWLGDYHNLTAEELAPYLYIHPEHKAVQHLMRVASGLDSLVIGEPQILGQVKDAYLTACDAGTVGMLLNKLFQHTFSVAKQVRTDTAIGASPVSVAFAAVNLAKQIFSNFQQHTVLLIGAGETMELAARHLTDQEIGRMIVANRTVEKAHTLASTFNGYAIALPEITTHLSEADIVMSSTASPLPILGKGAFESALKVRKHRPMLVVDIAVPRDIEPEVADLDDVYLYTVDDLQEIIDENLQSRRDAAQQADDIIETQVAHFMGWVRSLEAVATIRKYRHWANTISAAEVDKAKALLARGLASDEVLRRMASAITNKMAHPPTIGMRQAAFEGRADVLDVARQLFSLDDDEQ